MRNETVCMGKTLFAGLALLWAWTAVAEDVVVNITSAEDDYVIASTDDAYAQALLAGDKANRLYKIGGGRLVINCDFLAAGWKGELRVHEGFVRLQNDNALGTSDGGVVIDNGASLELDPVNGKAQLFAFDSENLTFEGVGADGEGCLKMLPTYSSWNVFRKGKKTMTGDALWNGTGGRTDVRFGTLDMGGHTLSCKGSIAFCGPTIVNPGKVRTVAGERGSLSLDDQVVWNGNASNEIIVDGATAMSLQILENPLPWTFRVKNNVSVSLSSNARTAITNMSSAVTRNSFEGPVVLENGARLRFVCWNEPGTVVNIRGPVTGDGKLNVYGTYPYLRLLNRDCSYSGGLDVDGCCVEAAGIGSLGSGPLTLSGTGRLVFLHGSPYDTYGMDDAEYARIMEFQRTHLTSTGYYRDAPNYSFPTLGDYTYASALTDGKAIYHDETNTLTLAGGVTGEPKIVNTAGTLVLGGPGVNYPGKIFVQDGTVKIAANATYMIGDNTYLVCGAYPRTPRLVVGENAMFAARADISTALPLQYVAGRPDDGSITKAENSDFSRGIVEILSGAVVTNQMTIGGGKDNDYARTNEFAALYLKGTLVQHSENSKTSCYVGNHAGGYFEISEGGYLDASQKTEWFYVGRRGSGTVRLPGSAVLHMKGGLMQHKSVGFVVNGGGSLGHMRVSGGAVSNGHVIVGMSLWVGNGISPSEGALTVEKQGTVYLTDDGGVQLGALSNTVAILNLNGGELAAKRILAVTNRCQTSGSSSQPMDYTGNTSLKYLNFNGGMYRQHGSYHWVGDENLTRATVFAGGATVDVGTENRELACSLQAPEGKGVKSAAFASTEPWRYIGAPYVRIVDPSGIGYGATATADFDSDAGLITGITVTSPGCNYGPGTYAEIDFGGWTNRVQVVCELADNANTGDFVKRGSGQLTIGADKCVAVGGTIDVAEGRLLLNAPQAQTLPNASSFRVGAGAVLDTRSTPLTAAKLAGTGEIATSVTLAGTLVVDAADLIAGRALTIGGSLTVAEGSRIQVLNAELLEALPRKTRLPLVRAEGGYAGPGFSAITPSDVGEMGWGVERRSDGYVMGKVIGMAINLR